jgi:hypothetical protein
MTAIVLLGVAIGAIISFIGIKGHELLTATRIVTFTNEAQASQSIEPIKVENAVQVKNEPMRIIQTVASEEKIDWKVLYGICMEESRGCQYGEVGDNGDSWGWFQINHPANPNVTKEQAHDLTFSARWTAKRLKHYASIGGWDYAIRKHNGNADYDFGKWQDSFQATLRYLDRVKSNIQSL